MIIISTSLVTGGRGVECFHFLNEVELEALIPGKI